MDDTSATGAAETPAEDTRQDEIARMLDQMDKAGFGAQRAYTNALLQLLSNPGATLVHETEARDERGTEAGAVDGHPAFTDPQPEPQPEAAEDTPLDPPAGSEA